MSPRDTILDCNWFERRNIEIVSFGIDMTVMALDDGDGLSYTNELNRNMISSYPDSTAIDFTHLLSSPEESEFSPSIFPNKNKVTEFDDHLPVDMRIPFGSTDSNHEHDIEQENSG